MSPSSGYFPPLFLLLISGALMSEKCAADSAALHGHAPVNRLELHRGGYNISDRHYWAATAFTGIHGYVIAGIWLLFGLGFGSYLILRITNSRTSSANEPVVDYPDSSYILFFSFIVLFSILAIVASSFVLVADKGSLHRTKKLVGTLLDAGSDAQRTMQQTKNILLAMQTAISPYASQTTQLLNATTHKLRRESLSIQSFIDNSKHSSNEAIVTLYVANLAVVIANLAFLVAALVSFFVRWPLGLIILIFCCWILTTLCWILTGVNFFFHNVAEDTCNALDDFARNPQNSSMQSLVPCANSTNSSKLLKQIGFTIHSLMSQINSKLVEIPLMLQTERVEDGDGDGSLLWEICDPFSGAPNYTFTPDRCPKNAIPIGNLPNILSRFTCYDSSRNCEGEGRFLPEAIYDKCRAFSESLQDLIDIFPDLVSLIQCSQITQAFSSIVQRQCKPFREAALYLWSSMLSLSIFMVFVTLLWVAKAYQDKGKCFSRCSIVPEHV